MFIEYKGHRKLKYFSVTSRLWLSFDCFRKLINWLRKWRQLVADRAIVDLQPQPGRAIDWWAEGT